MFIKFFCDSQNHSAVSKISYYHIILQRKKSKQRFGKKSGSRFEPMSHMWMNMRLFRWIDKGTSAGTGANVN